MRDSLRLIAVASLVLAVAAPRQAQAGLVQIGSTYTVNNINFVDTFSQNVTFDGTGSNKSIDGGKLLVNEQVFQTGPNGAWVQFTFSSSNGGALAANLNANWQAEIDNLSLSAPAYLDGSFCYFSVNGTPVSNIQAGEFSGVETNPITGSGQVLVSDVTPGAPFTSFYGYVYAYPYSTFSTENNIDVSTANEFTMAFHFDVANPVPEPASLALAGVAIGAMAARSLWRTRRRTGTEA